MTRKKTSGAQRAAKAKAKAEKDAQAEGLGDQAGDSSSDAGSSASEAFEIPQDAAFSFNVEASLSNEEAAEKRKAEGTEAYKSKSYTEAVRLYSEAIEQQPDFVPAIFNRAAAYMALKRFSQALEDCEAVKHIQGAPPQFKTLARLGKCQLALGQIDAASSTLLSARDVCTEPPSLSAIQADLGKIERIRNHINAAERERQGSNWTLMSLAVDHAIKEVESPPLAWRVLRLQALIGKKAFDEATFYATDIVRSNPANPEALFWRGQLFWRSGNFDQAKIHFERAHALDPDFSLVIPSLKKIRLFESRRDAGKQAFTQKDYATAVERYTQALDVDPDNEHVQVLFMSNRALALNALKRYEEALEDCERILNLQATHFKALRSKARAQLGLEQYEESVQSFTAAFEAADSATGEQRSVKIELESAQRELKRSKQKDYYKVLGLKRTDNPTDSEIKKAYRKESLLHHPDKGGSEENFKAVAEAYSVLSDPQKKHRHDMGEDIGGESGGMPDFGDMFGGGFGGGGFGGFGGFDHGGYGGHPHFGGARYSHGF